MNGIMIADKNKEITIITYNPLNLPSLISGGNKTISYIYDASGRKLAKVADNPTTRKKATYYQGNFVYKDAALDYILDSEGLIYSNGTNYNYQLKDHLGNVRMVVDADGNIQQQTDYYPFGLELASNGKSDNQYKYNGKEAQEDAIVNGTLDWLDYAGLGRWHTIDPSAENYLSHSSYAYVLNNPMNLIDPDGRDARVSSSADSLGNVTNTIQSTIYIPGKGASEKRAEKLNKKASKTLKSQIIENEDGTTTTVKFDVTYVYAEDTKDITWEQGDNILTGLPGREQSDMNVHYSQVLNRTTILSNGDIL